MARKQESAKNVTVLQYAVIIVVRSDALTVVVPLCVTTEERSEHVSLVVGPLYVYITNEDIDVLSAQVLAYASMEKEVTPVNCVTLNLGNYRRHPIP